MHIFITGATGYIGGAVAARLLADGHRVFGLARTPEKARALAARGIAPVAGTLVDLGTLREAAQAADAVINAASVVAGPAARQSSELASPKAIIRAGPPYEDPQ